MGDLNICLREYDFLLEEVFLTSLHRRKTELLLVTHCSCTPCVHGTWDFTKACDIDDAHKDFAIRESWTSMRHPSIRTVAVICGLNSLQRIVPTHKGDSDVLPGSTLEDQSFFSQKGKVWKKCHHRRGGGDGKLPLQDG